jgi:hypothetical protein
MGAVAPGNVTGDDIVGGGLLKCALAAFPQLFPSAGQVRGGQRKASAGLRCAALIIIQLLLRIPQRLAQVRQSPQQGRQFSHPGLSDDAVARAMADCRIWSGIRGVGASVQAVQSRC